MDAKKTLLLVIYTLTTSLIFSQASFHKFGFLSKEFSKELSIYYAKTFIMEEILGNSNNVVKFEINALAAASSGELTSLVYKSDDLKKKGLVLGFYGDRWNDHGVVYQSYAFKDLPEDKAIELLSKLDSITNKYSKYVNSDLGTNNIYFQYDDMTFLIYNTTTKTILRVGWNGFDSEWEWNAVYKTQKRLLTKLK